MGYMRYVDSFDDIEVINEKTVLIDSSTYPDQPRFLSGQNDFLYQFKDYLSRYGLLHDTFMTQKFISILEEQEYQLYVMPNGKSILEKILSWSEPLSIQGLNLPPVGDNPPGLFPYQQFGIRKAMDFYDHNNKSTTFFFNHATGTGKSILASALIQEMMINQKLFDYTFVFTLKKNKKNFTRDINGFTQANAVRNEGTADKRAKWYCKPEFNVFVMNYEKAHYDSESLKNLIRRKRVLFIFDEIQKILSYPGNRKNISRKGLDVLTRASSKQFFIPTSASVVNGNPLRYWRVFDFGKPNPFGTSSEFKHKYGDEVTFWNFNRWDKRIDWDEELLGEVRHVIAPQTHSVRKTDPGVKEYFKDTEFIPVFVEMSDEDRKLYDLIRDTAKQEIAEQKRMGRNAKYVFGPYFNALRLLCTTPESLKYTDNTVGKALRDIGIELTSKHCAKMEMIIDKIESIIDQGDKVVVFTHWSNLTLKPYSDALRDHRINHVVHHGSMSENEAQKAQDAFKTDPKVSVFLSSDAGSHALSFPEAKYVINIEVPHSYDLLMQRGDRIDRVNSYHEGITSYVYIVEDSVEEYVWKENQKRMRMAALVQGTTEELGRPKEKEATDFSDSLFDLIFN